MVILSPRENLYVIATLVPGRSVVYIGVSLMYSLTYPDLAVEIKLSRVIHALAHEYEESTDSCKM